jgi:hypothetical protein
VVAQLAAKHDIKVTLRSSPYGGVAAVVLIPNEFVVTPEDAAALGTGYGAYGSFAANGHPPEPRASVRMLTAGPPESALASGAPTETTDPEGAATGPVEPTAVAVGSLVAQPGDPPPLTPDGLPQRVRRTGRPASGADRGPMVPGDDDADVTTGGVSRTAERMRTMLTSFQDGMRLGRRDAHLSVDGGDPSPTGPGEAGARPATPAGDARPVADGATAPDGDATPPEAGAAPEVATATSGPAATPETDVAPQRPRTYVRRHERPHR